MPASCLPPVKRCRSFVTLPNRASVAFLDLPQIASQTSCMAHTYMVFEFPNEEKAQQARHKLEGWKQAFRLDKKLQVKFDRGEEATEEAADSGPVKLLVRLYFSNHEKITEQQWFDRIPADDLFKVAHPHVIHEKDAAFDDTLKQFDTLE